MVRTTIFSQLKLKCYTHYKINILKITTLFLNNLTRLSKACVLQINTNTTNPKTKPL